MEELVYMERVKLGSMNILFIFLICIISVPAFAATSTSYAITPEVIDLGGEYLQSTSYRLLSKMREVEPVYSTSTSYTMEGRFTGVVNQLTIAATFEPIINSITPNSGSNDNSYKVVISGSQISNDAIAWLERTGFSNINGTNISRAGTPASIECTLALTNETAGAWDVVVQNVGYGKTGRLNGGFTIASVGSAKIIGTPTNEPNPFNPSNGPTHIRYKLSAASGVTLYLFNQRGELIWQRVCPSGDEGGKMGDNDVLWSGYTRFDEGVPTGVYMLYIISKSGGTKELGKVKIAVLRQ